MAIVASLSKFKKTNLLIYIAACVLAAVVFGYDGYLSKYKWSKRYSFYEEHVIENDGKPTTTMQFNRISPPFFLAGAALLGIYFFAVRNRNIVAEDSELVLNSVRIPYDSIQKIDKTDFDRKGRFTITYDKQDGSQADLTLSDRSYDNLHAVLDVLVAHLTGQPSPAEADRQETGEQG